MIVNMKHLAPLVLVLAGSSALAQGTQAQDEPYRQLQSVPRATPEVLVVRAVAPAVVFIETEVTQQVNTFWGRRNQTFSGSGSGVVIHTSGYIVTNFHVVKGAKRITVTFDGDPRRYPAELVSAKQSEDLALLRIEAPSSVEGETTFPTVRMGTSADLMRGERVVAIGNPHGQAHTVSTGIISGLHRDVPLPEHGLHFQNLIQTDASINLGNSGGPLLNIRGELIGINTVMNSMAENIGFAIPVDRVKEVLTETLFPQAQRRWLGFELAEGVPLEIGSVVAGTPADDAELCEGYRILALNGKPVTGHEDFLHAALEIPERVGDPVADAITLTVRNEEGRKDVIFDPWDRVDGVLFQRLGITVREQLIGNQDWIVIDRVRPGGAAEEIGLRRGDLIPSILPVERSTVPLRIRDRITLAQLVERLDLDDELALDVYRDDNRDGDYTRNERYEGTLKVR